MMRWLGCLKVKYNIYKINLTVTKKPSYKKMQVFKNPNNQIIQKIQIIELNTKY